MLEEYVKQLLKEKGLPDNLEPAVHEQLVKDLTLRLTNLINKRLVEAMNDEQLKQFETLMDSQPDNPEALQQYIEENVANKQQVTSAALLEFRQLYLGRP